MGKPDEEDPYGIVPPEFMDRFPEADTIGEALKIAGRQKSDTDADDRRRCPYCLSKQVSKKSGKYDPGNRRPETFKCTRAGCRRHFDKPADETTIPMTADRTDPFDWIDREELSDPDTRSALDPPFADADRETAVALAILLRRPWRDEDERRNYPEIARYLPYADSWVGHRIREWRDGDHRDLVPDPTPDPEPDPSSDPPIDPSVALARIGGDYEELVDERTARTSDATAAADGGTRRSRWAAYGSD